MWTSANRRTRCADRCPVGAEARRERGGRVPSGAACPRGAGSLTTRGRPRASVASRHAAEAADHSLHARLTEVSRADPSRRREQPTTGPCSVDESVVSLRRCQRIDTRSFHGLCSPPRSTRRPLQPGPCRERADTRAEARAPTMRGRLLRPTRAPLGSLRRLPLATPRRSGASETSPGAEADPERRAFSARRPRPGSAPRLPRSGRSRPGEQGGVAGVCPEARS